MITHQLLKAGLIAFAKATAVRRSASREGEQANGSATRRCIVRLSLLPRAKILATFGVGMDAQILHPRLPFLQFRREQFGVAQVGIEEEAAVGHASRFHMWQRGVFASRN